MKMLSASEIIDLYHHDLKSPITSIKSIVAILSNNSSFKRRKELQNYLLKIENKTETLNSLIDKLIDLILVQNKKLKFYYELINIDDFLKDFLKDFKIKENNFNFVLNGEVNKNIVTDRVRLKQILNFLIQDFVNGVPQNSQINLDVIYESNHVSLTISSQKRKIVKQPKDLKREMEIIAIKEINRLLGGKVKEINDGKSIILYLPLKPKKK